MFLFSRLMNNRGCFGGGGKTNPPAPPAPPAPAPGPTPTIISPSNVEGVNSEEERRKKLQKMRQGLSSTIKTSARGISGSGPDLLQQTIMGKDKIGQ